MTTNPYTVERLEAKDLPGLEALLAENDLPSRDVRGGPSRFYGIFSGGELTGAGGLEIYGSVGLLRSVVVEESSRGQGLGTLLCDALEDRARAAGVETLYLLTTSASGFFDQRGYSEIDRSATPSSIRQTTEFSDLCPTSALCMQKHIQ